MSEPERGFTLIELVIVVAIVGILASGALSLARWSVKRSKEHQLQQNLRILRNAIDRYHDAAEAGLIEVAEGANGYPASLKELVEGVPLIGQMPPIMPAVSDEYGATGPGLTGGLSAQLQADQQAGGLPGMTGGASQGLPGQPAASGQASPGSGGLQLGNRPGGRGLQIGTRGGSGGLQLSQRPTSSATGFGQRPGLGGTRAQQTAGETAQPLLGSDGQPVKLILLRRLPIDPFTGQADWGLRCYGEPPTDRMWCGRDVFDIYSKSFAKAIDNSNYRDW